MVTKPNNHLLASLSSSDWSRLQSQFEPVALIQDFVLIESGQRFSHAYFPENSVISTVATFESGNTAETAMTGAEGLVSIHAAFGGIHALYRKIVLVPGMALRVETQQLQLLIRENNAMRDRVFAYTQVLMAQVMQSVACNGIHSIEERCARWLLMCHDRCVGDRFPLTQESLAEMLGVSRPSVNRVTRAMQADGLIRSGRGSITVGDRPGLEAAACECYAAVRRHFDRLLPGSFTR